MNAMMDEYVKGSQGQLTKEKAFEMIMVHVFSRCYKKSSQETVDKIHKEQPPMDDPIMRGLIEENSLKHPLNPHKEQLSTEEWDVVNEVLEEERKKQGPPKQTPEQKKAQRERAKREVNSDLYGLPGFNMSGGMKFIYMISVSFILIMINIY